MRSKNKYIELLLILIIPTLFTIITIKDVNNILKESRKTEFINVAKMVVVDAENKYLRNKMTGIYNTINCNNIVNSNISYCSIYIDDNEVKVTLKGNNKFYGLNVCSNVKDNIRINKNCDNICFQDDIVDVNKPYKIADSNSCIEYTKNYFVTDLGFTLEDVSSICKDQKNIDININKLLSVGLTEMDLVKNKVIKGNVNNVCIPNEIKKNCYSFKIYTEKEKKYAEITGYDDVCGKDIQIPGSVMGIPVEGISDYAFHQKNIRNVSFPNSIRYIGTGAFQGHGDGENSVLQGVYLNGNLDLSSLVNLEKIDYFAFADNDINKVIFPSSLKEIGSYAFSGNSITGELDLSNTKLTRVDSYVFSSSNITNIKLPNTISSIAFTAFAGNDIYGELDLSKYTNLTVIEEDAFAHNKITSIKLPSSIKEIKKMAFYNNNISGELDLFLNENLVSIGENAFENNNIETVILPLSIKNISNSAFLKNDISNPNLMTLLNPTDIEFDWKEIVINIDDSFNVINN